MAYKFKLYKAIHRFITIYVPADGSMNAHKRVSAYYDSC